LPALLLDGPFGGLLKEKSESSVGFRENINVQHKRGQYCGIDTSDQRQSVLPPSKFQGVRSALEDSYFVSRSFLSAVVSKMWLPSAVAWPNFLLHFGGVGVGNARADTEQAGGDGRAEQPTRSQLRTGSDEN